MLSIAYGFVSTLGEVPVFLCLFRNSSAFDAMVGSPITLVNLIQSVEA
jgi:hypothetical protein